MTVAWVRGVCARGPQIDKQVLVHLHLMGEWHTLTPSASFRKFCIEYLELVWMAQTTTPHDATPAPSTHAVGFKPLTNTGFPKVVSQ